MLKLAVSPDVEAFRKDFQNWLTSNKPPAVQSNSLDDFVTRGRSWQQKLASDNWVGVHWPEEFGGRGLSLVEEAVVQEELVRVNSPQLLGLFGLTMVGPVLIEHGTAEQKKEFLADILTAEKIWCQGFSEPAAGSDLANIKTKATVSKAGFHITGQKTWTSFAHIADYCFVLCRTSEAEKKHQGLSYLLTPMRVAGITTRPLKQISGDDEFNEVFFDSVFVPASNIVGAIGEGWKIAISTLMYERVVLTFARQLQSEVTLRSLIEEYGDSNDPQIVSALAAATTEATSIRALAYKHLLQYARGAKPGPEGSLDKLLWSESFQKISRLALLLKGTDTLFGESDPRGGETMHRYLYSRGRTIAAGTSEIQRSIIAERVLGLPRQNR